MLPVVTNARPLSIYLHWPFCGAKCPYCDFNSHVRPSIDEPRWIGALTRALDHWKQRVPDRQIDTIFWGGGTPSLIAPASVQHILAHIGGLWPIADDCEITLEANPTTHEAARFVDLRDAGVNRLSLGVQSFDQSALNFLGRTYSVSEAERALSHIAETFPRYSFDMIYALPDHTLDLWQRQLEYARTYVGEHLSLYQLTFEPGTRFYQALQTGRMTPLDDEIAADLLEFTVERMAELGLQQYEISNFARPGAESRHNMVYWRGGDWIGVGPGAHGRYGISDERVAVTNVRSPERWLTSVESGRYGVETENKLPSSDRGEELVLTGLRLAEGIDKQQFSTVAGYALDAAVPPSKRAIMVAERLAWETEAAFGLTASGRMVLDSSLKFLLAGNQEAAILNLQI